jgi:hypothetical protein
MSRGLGGGEGSDSPWIGDGIAYLLGRPGVAVRGFRRMGNFGESAGIVPPQSGGLWAQLR